MVFSLALFLLMGIFIGQNGVKSAAISSEKADALLDYLLEKRDYACSAIKQFTFLNIDTKNLHKHCEIRISPSKRFTCEILFSHVINCESLSCVDHNTQIKNNCYK